jgi:hypothetical protein
VTFVEKVLNSLYTSDDLKGQKNKVNGICFSSALTRKIMSPYKDGRQEQPVGVLSKNKLPFFETH